MAYSSAMLRRTLWGLECTSVSRHQLLAGVVDESKLSQDFWLTDEAYYEIITRALSHDPALGLAVGQRESSYVALGAPGLHARLVRSFSRAVAAIVRFNGTLCDRQDVVTFEDGDTLTVQVGPFDASLRVRRFLAEMALVSLRQLFTQFAGRSSAPVVALFDYPAPPYASDYSGVFGCPVRFDAARSALIVPRALAEKQQLLFQPALAEELGRLAEASSSSSRHPHHLAERLRLLLRQSRKSKIASMAELASQLGLSERSLRRRLTQQGLHYRTIVAEDRSRMARDMLQSGMCVKEIAYELGYQSPSAFYKAFRRWGGETPKAFVASTDVHGRRASHFDGAELSRDTSRRDIDAEDARELDIWPRSKPDQYRRVSTDRIPMSSRPLRTEALHE